MYTYVYVAGSRQIHPRSSRVPLAAPHSPCHPPQVGEIQGLLKNLPPPLNAEYLPIPVAAIELRASTDYASGVTSTVEMVSFQTLMQTLVNSVYGEAIDQPGVHTSQFFDSPAVQWRKVMTKSALFIQRRYRAQKGAAPVKHGVKVNRLLVKSAVPAAIRGLSSKALQALGLAAMERGGAAPPSPGLEEAEAPRGVSDVAVHWQKATFTMTEEQKRMVAQRQSLQKKRLEAGSTAAPAGGGGVTGSSSRLPTPTNPSP